MFHKLRHKNKYLNVFVLLGNKTMSYLRYFALNNRELVRGEQALFNPP